MVKLTGVNDEPSKEWNLDTGLDALEEIGTHFVELRAVDGKNIDDLTDDEFDRVKSRISERGFTVTGYDSNLGKCDLDEANWAREEERFALAVKRTDQLGVQLIRTMGFRRAGISVTEWHSKTLDWFERLEKMAREADKTIVLENCLFGDVSMGSHPQDCLTIMQHVDSPHLRMNLDPGNFAYFEQDPELGYQLLAQHTANVHVKDCHVPRDNSTFCLAGEGIAKVPETLAALKAVDYSGCVTIEPHLRMNESFHYSGKDDYIKAGKHILSLLKAAGFEIQLHP